MGLGDQVANAMTGETYNQRAARYREIKGRDIRQVAREVNRRKLANRTRDIVSGIQDRGRQQLVSTNRNVSSAEYEAIQALNSAEANDYELWDQGDLERVDAIEREYFRKRKREEAVANEVDWLERNYLFGDGGFKGRRRIPSTLEAKEAGVTAPVPHVYDGNPVEGPTRFIDTMTDQVVHLPTGETKPAGVHMEDFINFVEVEPEISGLVIDRLPNLPPVLRDAVVKVAKERPTVKKDKRSVFKKIADFYTPIIFKKKKK